MQKFSILSEVRLAIPLPKGMQQACLVITCTNLYILSTSNSQSQSYVTIRSCAKYKYLSKAKWFCRILNHMYTAYGCLRGDTLRTDSWIWEG